MNLTISDNLLGRQRTRQWSPLVTQQYRLRHVHQLLGLNFPHLSKKGAYYYTLHLTLMSAPFYTSDKVENANPKWVELDLRDLSNLAISAFVVRVWCSRNAADDIVSTWGVNLSGLIFLGNKIVDIQGGYFTPNTVIFNIRGSFFTCRDCLKEGGKQPPFFDNLNFIEKDGERQIFKKCSVQVVKSEVRDSYNMDKLRRLHSLQVTIRNKSIDVGIIRDKIEVRLGTNIPEKLSPQDPCPSSSLSSVRYAPQLLTMKSVNKMMEEKPTKMQRKEMEKMRNMIEIEQFRSKMLSQERDKKLALIRRLKNKLKELIEENERKNLQLMDDYYKLRKETEKLRDMKKHMCSNQELLITLSSQLHQRRRQLLQQLLFIYPIQQHSQKKYTIHGIYLPNSDILSDCSDGGVSVALGYITHLLLMSSSFLQVPLRYPMTHNGSRSYITDHVSPIIPDRERDFPLFTKGKERIQFTYAVYLLNKNIAQLRWHFFMHTPELKATLSNLLGFLESKDCRETLPLVTCTVGMRAEPEMGGSSIEESLRRFQEAEPPKRYEQMLRACECGRGLSEILAIPEAFMERRITSDSFKSYAANRKLGAETAAIVIKEGVVDEERAVCDHDSIEEGTDLLKTIDGGGEECPWSGEHKENLIEWMKNGNSSECCSNDGTCDNFEDMAVEGASGSPLMARTDALVQTKSFNLVRPKQGM